MYSELIRLCTTNIPSYYPFTHYYAAPFAPALARPASNEMIFDATKTATAALI